MPGHLLPVYIEACSVFFLRTLDTYPTRRKPGSPDAAVGDPHHCYVDPTLYIAAFPGVRLTLLSGKADGKKFHSGLPLGTQQVVY